MLSPLVQKFVLHWGEMASRWGVSRTVAQIHALLFAAERPLSAGEIAEELATARSQISISVRELQSWGLIRVVHQVGDRRDFFEAIADPAQLIASVVKMRLERELDPVLEILRECVYAVPPASAADKQVKARMLALLESVESTHALLRDLQQEVEAGKQPQRAKSARRR